MSNIIVLTQKLKISLEAHKELGTYFLNDQEFIKLVHKSLI